jgi:hypothetical protein
MKAFFKLLFIVVILAVFGFLIFGLGPLCVNFVLLHTLHHTIPYIWAWLLDIFTGGISLLAAIIVKVLMLLGVIAG